MRDGLSTPKVVRCALALPCPQCGSHRSLGSLRKKLLEVKLRIDSVKRYRSDHAHTHSPAGHSHALFDDPLFINDAWVEVCADCGAFYAPNADEVGDAIQQEIYKLDPLGALAEIRGLEEGP